MRGAYRIIDPECMRVLSALTSAFEHAELPFAIAGGMGVQALLASKRLDHLLRRTGDIDVVVLADDAAIVHALNELAATHPDLRVVQNPAAKNARVGPMNIDWINEATRVKGLESVFRASVDPPLRVRVRSTEIPVQDPLVLLAAKLTGQKVRPQDELDIAGVIRSGTPIDEERLRDLVSGKAGRFDVYSAIKADVQER